MIEDLFDRFSSPSENQDRRSDQSIYKALSRSSHSYKARIHQEFQSRCNICLESYHISDFPLTARRMPPDSRSCATHDGQLWLCPYKIWTLEQIVALGCASRYSDRLAGVHGLCQCGNHFTSLKDDKIIQAFPIGVFPTQASVEHAALRNSIGACHLRICPHKSLSDPTVMERCFQRDCIRTFNNYQYECECDVCEKYLSYNCEQCMTAVQFRQHHNNDGSIILFLLVEKYHVNTPILDQPNYSIWRRRLFWPSEIKRLKEEWREYAPLLTRDPLVKKVLSSETDPFEAPDFHW